MRFLEKRRRQAFLVCVREEVLVLLKEQYPTLPEAKLLALLQRVKDTKIVSESKKIGVKFGDNHKKSILDWLLENGPKMVEIALLILQIIAQFQSKEKKR